MQVFNRNVSVRGLTVFGFEIILISGSMALAASLHGGFNSPETGVMLWKIAADQLGSGTRWTEIRDLNALKSEQLRVNMRLKLPGRPEN